MLKRIGELMVGTVMLLAVIVIAFQSISERSEASIVIEHKLANPDLKILIHPQPLQPTPEPELNDWDVSELGWVGCSWFGGPLDKIEYGNTLALYPNTYAQDLDYLNDTYVAIRYPTKGYSQSQLRRAEVVLEANGLYIEARIVDWGPHTRTGRGVDCSKGILEALGVVTDDLIKVTVFYPNN